MKGQVVSEKFIEQKIFLIRGHKVMFDHDLADLYGVSTKRLNEQVKRNKQRFPEDFMFNLTKEEFARISSASGNLRSQNGFGLIKSVDDACHCRLIPVAT